MTKRECCELCGAEEDLHDHHLIFRSRFGSKQKKERDNPRNIITVCSSCHSKIHDHLLKLINVRGMIYAISTRAIKKIKIAAQLLYH